MGMSASSKPCGPVSSLGSLANRVAGSSDRSRSRSPKTENKVPAPRPGREARILAVREEVIDAVVWRRHGKLALAAKGLLRLEVDVPTLLSSGIGVLASDPTVWPDSASKDWAKRAADK